VKVEALIDAMLRPMMQKCSSLVSRAEMERQLFQIVVGNKPVANYNVVPTQPAYVSEFRFVVQVVCSRSMLDSLRRQFGAF
jgi:hypothetical protein